MLRLILSLLISFQITFGTIPYLGSTRARADQALTLTQEQEKQREVYRSLYYNLLGSNDKNPLDFFSLLRQDFYAENAKGINHSPDAVVFSARDEISNVVKRFTARESFNEGFDGVIRGGADSVGILLSGKLVHVLRVPMESLAVLGDYIVFIEKGSYSHRENIRQISFIDLNYFRLGYSEMPIFRVPVEGHEKVESFEIRQGNLILNDVVYERGLFDFATSMQRVLYNVNVNLTDAKQFARIVDFAEPFFNYFQQNLETAKRETSSEEQKKALQKAFEVQQKEFEKLKANTEVLKESDFEKMAEMMAAGAKESITKANEGLKKQRALVGRVGLLWEQLSVPRPADAGQLKNKLITLAVGMYHNTYRKSDFKELVAEILSNSTIRITASGLAAISAAYYFPEQSLFALQSTFEMVRYVGEATFGKAVDLASLGVDTVVATFQGLNPMKLYDVYVAHGAWMKTSVGVTAMFTILMMVVGIPHVLLNTYSLIKDFRTADYISWQRRLIATEEKIVKESFFRMIRRNFILRQRQVQKAYIEALSDEKKAQIDIKEENKVSDAEQERMAQEFLAEDARIKKEHEGLLSRLKNSSLVQKISEKLKHFSNIEGFAGAVAHFLFSFASFTKSGIFYATTWNYFYLTRVFLAPPKPKLAMTLLLFPNFFNRSVATELGKITPPSYWNGGMRWFWEDISVRIRKRVNKDYYESLKAFEESVIEVEKKANELAMIETFKALQKYLEFDGKKILKLSESADASKKLTSKSISSLSYDARSFFSTYFDKLVERSMREYLVSANADETRRSQMTDSELKKWFVVASLKATDVDVDISELIKRNAANPTLYQEAYDIVHKSKNLLEKVGHTERHNAMASLDPSRAGQFKRFVLAERQMKKATAMARAVRANIVATLIDKPMELALLFVLVAGVTDGPNKPLWDVMFGPDSAFYMSRYVFMGYLSGLIVNIFADVWVKVQQDIRVEEAGGFEQVPDKEFRDKPFRSWYWHQFRTNPENKWWDHHKYFSEIIYHNLGPAFILFAITGMATMGRIDLDFYFLGYMTAFFLPFTGLSLKFEQTFEIASGWVLRNVPEAIRAHPLILNWANQEMTKLRMSFQFAYKLYENVLGQLIGNFMGLTTVRSGTRSLSRILFGGKTLTEHAIEKTTALSEKVPELRFTEDVCRLFFAKNYTSGTLPPPSK